MSDILELETRRKIYELISKNPGLHLSKIAELLHMRTSLVEYHLFFLEKNGIVHSVKERGYIRFYIRGDVGTEDKKILSLLRQETPLRIILCLLKNKNMQHKEILKNLEISPSTLSYHLKKLVSHDVVNVQSYGEERGYSVNNKTEIVRILVQYKPYSVIEGFKDVWLDLTV